MNPKTGKQVIKILPFYAPNPIVGKRELSREEDAVSIPCGQCIGCRLDYAKQWQARILCELQMHDKETCHFITLTFDDDYIAEQCNLGCDSNGEVGPVQFSLSKRHLQLFMKRLRKMFPDQRIRFYGVGEYGSKSYRPHYHVIVFGLRLPDNDLKIYKRSSRGYSYFFSDAIFACWPYGFNVVAGVTAESAGYTARYMLKKQKGEDSVCYDDYNIQAPFSLSSRKPGIGYSYYEENKGKIWENSNFVIPTEKGSKSFPPPKYFIRKFEEQNPGFIQVRSEIFQDIARHSARLEQFQTDLDELEILAVKEREIKSRTKILDSRDNF